jgi:hypothetical protein
MDPHIINNPIKNPIGIEAHAKDIGNKIGMLDKIADRLAAVAHPLAAALPFLTRHQAIPLIKVTTKGIARMKLTRAAATIAMAF